MMTTTNKLTPTKAINRIHFLDALRGIAIFFIFTANIPYLSGFFFFKEANPYAWAVFPFDEGFEMILHTLVDGKFYTIFSLLFGIGFTIQYENLKKRDLSFKPFFRRRMFWLLIFGGLHLCLIWIGDILTLYALLGFALLNFVETDGKKLLKWSVILILFPIINCIVISFLGIDYPRIFFQANAYFADFFNLQTSKSDGLNLVSLKGEFANENLLSHFQITFSNMFIRIGYILYEGRPFKVLGIFLIGIWAGRNIIHAGLLNNTAVLKKIALYGILIGLPISSVRTFFEVTHDGSKFYDLYVTVTYALGTVPLALGFAALLALLYLKRSSLFRWFEPVGKMALTNYILQSTLSILVFYGIGLGMVGKFGYSILILYCCIFYALQIIFSTLWLKKFKMGPLEMLWRKFTYRK